MIASFQGHVDIAQMLTGTDKAQINTQKEVYMLYKYSHNYTY